MRIRVFKHNSRIGHFDCPNYEAYSSKDRVCKHAGYKKDQDDPYTCPNAEELKIFLENKRVYNFPDVRDGVLCFSIPKEKTWEITRDKFLSNGERGKLLSYCEAKKLLDQKHGRKTWIKRYLLIDLALFSGLRVSEIVNLKISDLKISRNENLIHVRRGKGGKSGYVIIDPILAKHLKEYIEFKKLISEKIDPESFLLTINGKKYTRQALEYQFKQAVKEAGLSRDYSIHSARHSFATYLLAETKNLRLVQKQLRHSTPAITAVYADILPEDLTEAMEKFRDSAKRK